MNNKDETIEKTKQHIQQIRKNSPDLESNEMKIALGKVFCELKLAKKHDTNILKKIFTIK